VGVKHALTLAATYNKPVVPVHHMEAHALIARMPKLNPEHREPMQFPALLMLVSGGHNMLVRSQALNVDRP
jgi:N6-L-threonylcarbamoyladenine synthase